MFSTTIHRYPILSTRHSVTCKVYTGYHDTSEIEHGSCACTVDNLRAKARGLSLCRGAQTMLYPSLRTPKETTHNVVCFFDVVAHSDLCHVQEYSVTFWFMSFELYHSLTCFFGALHTLVHVCIHVQSLLPGQKQSYKARLGHFADYEHYSIQLGILFHLFTKPFFTLQVLGYY